MMWNDIDDDAWKIFSERELMPVRLSFVTLMHPGTLAIRWHPQKILRRSSQGNLSVGGVKHEAILDVSNEGYILETVQDRR